MIFKNLINRGAMPVLEQVMNFTEARHEVLTNNISNLDTVGYKMRDLDVKGFYATLDNAINRRDKRGVGAPLDMKSSRNFSWDRQGGLSAREVPAKDSNILFHDRNNRSVEKQMSLMAKNAMMHNVATELLRQQYGQLKQAISGKL